MKTLIFHIWMILVPSLVSAETVCTVIEFSEHYEATCIGDEKVASTPETKHAPASQTIKINRKPGTATTDVSDSPMQDSASSPRTVLIPKSSLTAETNQKPPATTTASTEISATAAHRQGRQQFSRALQDAIAARLQSMPK